MTKVRVKRFINCPFSAAVELAEKVVNRRDGLYLTPAPPLGERVRFAAAAAPDSSDRARKHDALLIAWQPRTAGMFPEFHGVLTVRPKGRGVSLHLNGEYEPPYGTAGKVFDFLAGRTIAQSTMRHFLDDLARDIELEYDNERLTKSA